MSVRFLHSATITEQGKRFLQTNIDVLEYLYHISRREEENAEFLSDSERIFMATDLGTYGK